MLDLSKRDSEKHDLDAFIQIDEEATLVSVRVIILSLISVGIS